MDSRSNNQGGANPWDKMEEALNTFYGFKNMSPSEKEAFHRALRTKTPAQMAVRDEESSARFGSPAGQTGPQTSSRCPHGPSERARQSYTGNGGAEANPSPPSQQPPQSGAAASGCSEPDVDEDAMEWEEAPSPLTAGYVGCDSLMYCQTLQFFIGWEIPPVNAPSSPLFY